MEDIEDSEGIYQVPEDWTHIPAFKFYGCAELQVVVLPSSIKSIQYNAFAYSALESVAIPHTVLSIGTYAFAFADALVNVTLSESLLRILRPAFVCAFSFVTIPSSVQTIGQYAFADNIALVNVTIADSNSSGSGGPSSLREIGTRAFSNCLYIEAMALPGHGLQSGYKFLRELQIHDKPSYCREWRL